MRSVLPWIAVIVIVSLVMAPFIFREALTGFRDIWSDIRSDWFGDWGDADRNGDADTTLGTFSIAVLIHYTDGTKQEISPMTTIPLTILTQSGKEVSQIVLSLRLKMDYVGDLSSYSVKGRISRGFYDQSLEIWRDWTSLFTDSGSTWESGTTKDIGSDVWSAQSIETRLAERGTGYYQFYASAEATIDAQFEDGSSDSREATSGDIMLLSFEYQATGISVFSVTVNDQLL